MEEILMSRLRRITREIKTLSEQTAEFIIVNGDNIVAIEVIVSQLSNLLEKLGNELNNYFRLVNEPMADEISEISETQLTAELNLAELSTKLKLFKECSKPSSSSSSNHNGNQPSSCRLPKIDLPEFSGDILSFHQFWDQFRSNIHNKNIPDVDKLLYLKAAVKGEAKRVIDGLESTNKNYQIAIDTLRERYGKEAYLIDAHYKALSKLTVANSNVISCRRTYDEIERHLRVLGSLGEDTNHNHLRHLIFGKFPEDLIYELKLKLKGETVDEIRSQLEVILSAREDAMRITQGSENKMEENYTVKSLHITQKTQRHTPARIENRQPRGYPRRDFKNKEATRRPFRNSNFNEAKSQAKEEPATKRRRLLCAFCKESHYSDECRKYPTVKDRKARLDNKCFNCLSHGHLASRCLKKRKCHFCRSYGHHHQALCPTKFSHERDTKPSISPKTQVNISTVLHQRGNTILQTAVVAVYKDISDSSPRRYRLLFDTGSQRSYVTQRVVRDLNLTPEGEENLSVYTFGSKIPREFYSSIVKVVLETRSKARRTIYANVVPMISHGVPYDEALKNWKGDEVLADDGSLGDQVDILIGNDYYHTFLRPERKQVGDNLYLVNSEFGWIFSGQTSLKINEVRHMSVITYCQGGTNFKLNKPDLPIDQGDVTFLWELESIGITDSPKVTRDEEALNNFNRTTKLVNNRYQVSWPWNDYPPSLSPNYGLAHGRLVNLIKRLDKETLESYDKALREQMLKGIIERVEDNSEGNHPIHYLPHHCVAQKGKPIRIVYDASSKIKGNKSLNECLYCGPLMLEDLTCILIRFRSHNIGLSADVEKAFLQIGLQEHDRDVTRFLWLKDVRKPPSKDNLICFRFCRVPFGVIASPFLLNATVKHHLHKSNERLQNIARDIYVDNLVTGAQTTADALRVYEETKSSFKEISMNLRDWSSNSKDFMERIPDKTEQAVIKILGLDWKLKEDTLNMRFKISTEANTKREALKVLASIYDPCGFVMPHVLAAKLFIQELWTNKVKWDTPFTKELSNKWGEIKKDLENIKEIHITRCYIRNVKSNEYHLHCFTDASLKAYAAVIYVTNGTNLSFVIGKVRLVPVKDQQHLKIPRLELLGVLIGNRLMKMVAKAFNNEIGGQTLWSDSQIVIEWCKSDKLLPPFVARRVEEIRRNKGLMIKYVPTELNPADCATRPSRSMEDKNVWIKGPKFLTDSPDITFPVNNTVQTLSFSAREGLTNESKDEHKKGKERRDSTEDIDIESKDSLDIKKELKELQSRHFARESEGKETDLSRNLRVFKDIDGILRCKGRLQNSNLSFDVRYPILIPRECEFTNRLIQSVHQENYHVGVNHTLSLIRQSYWIPQGRAQVQRVLKKCERCVKHRAGPFKLPPTPALPAERANYSKPFTFVGVDYLGPVLVHGGQKRWICLFTCLAVRAIHLELVSSLTAEEGLLALRRMIATRGIPKFVTSDNATNFKLMADIFSDSYCGNNGIQWKFIPQLAPWFGGFYERLVGIVKMCMKCTLGKHTLSDNQLTTVVKEIEAVVNTRPLTNVGAEVDIILRPIDFLTLGKCVTTTELEEGKIIEGSEIRISLVESWKKGQRIVREFKEMFVNRYLLSLRERYQHSHREPRVTSERKPKVGQVVQIKGENKNRETWKVGKIISLKKGGDGLCRVAIVRVGNKDFTRSIAHLYPMEMQETEEDSDIRVEELSDSTGNSEERLAKMRGERAKEGGEGQVAGEEEEIPSVHHDNYIKGVGNSIASVQRVGNPVGLEIKPRVESEKESVVLEEETGAGSTNDSMELDSGPGVQRMEVDQESCGRRIAALKAREKIREWTSNLLNLI